MRIFDFSRQDKKSATNGTFEKIKEVGDPLFLSHKIGLIEKVKSIRQIKNLLVEISLSNKKYEIIVKSQVVKVEDELKKT